MPDKSESDITRIARLSGLEPEQVRYDLKGYCKPKGNQLEVTISDNEALKIISEKRNKLIWINGKESKPIYFPFIVSNTKNIVLILNNEDVLKYCFWKTPYIYEMPFYFWAYITPDMLPLSKG